METLIDLIRRTTATYPSRTALSTRPGLREEAWTYGQVWQAAQAIAHYFRNEKHLQPGDRVIILAPNSPHLVVTYFGALLARIIVVPLDPFSTPEFIKCIAVKTNASLMITDGKIPDNLGVESIRLAELPLDAVPKEPKDYPSPRDIAELVFTSGTTGDPKGVILTHRNIVSNVESAATLMPREFDYRFLSLLPLSHMLEQTVGLYLPLYFGGTVYYPTCRQSSVILKTLHRHRINVVVGVPQILKMMMQGIEKEVRCRGKWNQWCHAQDLARYLPFSWRRRLFSAVHRRLGGNLEFFICGGAHLPQEIAASWERLGVRVVEGYGATECAPIVASNSHCDRLHGSVGQAVPGVNVRLSAEGEVQVKGSNVTQGYWQHRGATAAAFTCDGWYRTGDLAEMDTSGRIFLKGRLNDLVVMSNGLNVYPEDVERALVAEDAVFDSVVLGILNNEGDMRLEAVIRPADPEGTPVEINQRLEGALRSANARLAPHQRISHFTVWGNDDFPRTSLLKVKRHEVRAFLSNGRRTHPTVQPRGKSDPDLLMKVRCILLQVTDVDACKITPKSHLDLDLGLDSLSRVELTSAVEEQLGIDLDESGLSEVETVKDLMDAIESKKPGSPTTVFPDWSLRPIPQLLRSAIQGLALFPLHRFLCRSFQIEGQENLQDLQLPALFVANHCSHFDTLSILRAMPKWIRQWVAVAAAADYFFRNQALAMATTLSLSTFPLSRSDAVRPSLEYCGQLVDSGWSILIYPEGTRSAHGRLQPFKDGIGLLASQLQVPVVPIGVEGGFQILPKGRYLPRPGPVTVRFGRPIEVSKDASHHGSAAVLEEAVRRLLPVVNGEQGDCI